MQESTQKLTDRLERNPLLSLEALGQSVWLDFICRGILTSGELRRFIEADRLSGVTANPSIFEKAIDDSHDYDQAIRALALKDKNPREMYEAIAKVPATREGLPAIRQLTSEGINVNVTLLFGLPRYRQVIEAYLSGLDERLAKGDPVTKIQSVASFFLSRIDVLVDPLLEKLTQQGADKAELAADLQGKIAVASAKVAYQSTRRFSNKASASTRSPGRVPTRSASCGPVPALRTPHTRI